MASASLAGVGVSDFSRVNSSSFVVVSVKTSWKKNRFVISFRLPVVGPVWPNDTDVRRPGESCKPLGLLPTSKGGAEPGCPRNPFSLNGMVYESTVMSGLLGNSIGTARLVM